MRVGTWNVEGRWTAAHLEFILGLSCDVLLLTEVNVHTELPGHHLHHSRARISRHSCWAAVAASASLTPLPDPHPASAAAVVGGWTCIASVLPWRGCGPQPWGEGSTGDRTERALELLSPALAPRDLIWGGDWNHALQGMEGAGSLQGRRALQFLLDQKGFVVPTAALPSALAGHDSIDHIAVRSRHAVGPAVRHDATAVGRRLSDHDAYVVEVADS